jgi:ssDNA-binding Zn-finger/Zn-ribbon topoisomerase 1
MIGKIRDALNQAPPWVSYGIVGVLLVVIIGFIVIQAGGGGGGGKDTDRHFYCTDDGSGFTLSGAEARKQMREAAKANPGQRVMLKNPKTGQYSAIPGQKCPKCGAYFEIPEKSGGGLFPNAWRDVCPKCNYSESRAQAIETAKKQKKEGKYDPNRIPQFMREDIEKALEQGGGK